MTTLIGEKLQEYPYDAVYFKKLSEEKSIEIRNLNDMISKQRNLINELRQTTLTVQRTLKEIEKQRSIEALAIQEEKERKIKLEEEIQERLFSYLDHSQPLTSRYNSAVRQAILREKTWDISPTEYNLLSKENCTYCGGSTGMGIGLDRIDNSCGYSTSNVLPCCGRCNLTRGNRYTVEETRRMISAIMI